jgi:hypothetical protein
MAEVRKVEEERRSGLTLYARLGLPPVIGLTWG